MGDVRDLYNDSRVQMAEVVAALINGMKLAEIESSLEIPRSRITRWFRDSKEFQEMLVDVEQAVIDDIKATVVAETAETMVSLLPKARSVLEKALSDEDVPWSTRVTAAAHVYRLSGHDVKRPEGQTAGAARAPSTARQPAAGD